MAVQAKIGVYQDENGTHVQYKGKPGELLELLSFLQAYYLVKVTDKPDQFQEVFKRLQTETATKFVTLKTDELKNKTKPQSEDSFLGEDI